MRWAAQLSHLSAYKRAEAHLTQRTTHGAIVTILGVLLGLTLATHEVAWYVTGKGSSKMMVDLARRHDLDIRLDITFPAVPCAGLSIDIMDASGSAANDANNAKDVHLHKIRLDAQGRRIGGKDGEYHTPQSQRAVRDASGTVMQIDLSAAMTQMGDMGAEINAHEGCRVKGDVRVRRVAGRLHFAVHQQSFIDVLPQMLTGHVLPKLTNLSHVITKVAFGPEFPGQVNPLDGFVRLAAPGEAPAAYKYFLKVVPTVYFSRAGGALETSQYSISEYAIPLRAPTPPGGGGGGAPGQAQAQAGGATTAHAFVDFSYDLSPILMSINTSPGSLLHFLVRLCAVVGGVLSVTRMADKALHAGLVAAGAVPASGRASGGGGAAARGSGGGISAGISSAGLSARTSLPGDAAAYASVGGGGFPSRTGSGGGLIPSRTGSGGGLLPDPPTPMHQRLGGGSAPGCHPLSRLNSVSGRSGISLASSGGSGAFPGDAPAPPPGGGSGGGYGGGGGYGYGALSAGGAPLPAAAGHVSHLLSQGGASSGGGAYARPGGGPSLGGGLPGSPANGAASRLAAATGPGPYSPLAGRGPLAGAPFGGQQGGKGL
ncbi:ergic3 [Scenedesmus sp. PABB004]|nr:ergic3 [Scenedesmus sp. PABB004]